MCSERTRQDEGRWAKESAWIGCGAPMEECEIMACEPERRDQEQITWAMKLKCFPQSVVSHGLGVAAKEARLLAVPRPETTRELLRASLGLNRPSSGGCLRSRVGGGCRVAQRRTW